MVLIRKLTSGPRACAPWPWKDGCFGSECLQGGCWGSPSLGAFYPGGCFCPLLQGKGQNVMLRLVFSEDLKYSCSFSGFCGHTAVSPGFPNANFLTPGHGIFLGSWWVQQFALVGHSGWPSFSQETITDFTSLLHGNSCTAGTKRNLSRAEPLGPGLPTPPPLPKPQLPRCPD